MDAQDHILSQADTLTRNFSDSKGNFTYYGWGESHLEFRHFVKIETPPLGFKYSQIGIGKSYLHPGDGGRPFYHYWVTILGML